MKIAVIDDTLINLTVMQSLLTRQALGSCHIFSNPFEGLDWCLQEGPDLIIVDYMMPGMDGLEFIRRCRADPAVQTLPILMVTAAAERELRYAALEAGATDFLTKPIDRNEFNPRVRNMLALRSNMLALSQRADELEAAVAIATEKILAREQETVARLARAAEFRDPETGAHIQRMAQFSRLIAARLGMSDEQQQRLLMAAPMHDVGKLATPDHILLKPGRLTPDELEIMRRHALIGHEILKDSASPVLQLAATIAVSHHEKFDGSGYPCGLRGEQIPIEGRIVAVADVFDALTSERSYKAAWSLERARAYLEAGSGTHFDPDCVRVFLAAWDEMLEIRHTYSD